MTDMNVRPLQGTEHLYCYAQSQQISMQTGLIGHLRADMDASGEAFLSSFFNFRENLKSEDFKADVQKVIDTLRENGFLKSRTELARYCNQHPECAFGEGRECGVRVDTKYYTYMMRLNPNKGEYNLYMYCYVKQWLDRHLQQAAKGIRFITPEYKDFFTLQDGDQVRICLQGGVPRIRSCRYIDNYHMELGSLHDPTLYHIHEFAEKVRDSGSTVIPLRASLPDRCYSYLESTGEMVELTKGEKGYIPVVLAEPGLDPRAEAAKSNKALGVTRAQEEAMLAGSMFGFHVPGADPKNYDENGTPVRPQKRDRGDAR